MSACSEFTLSGLRKLLRLATLDSSVCTSKLTCSVTLSVALCSLKTGVQDVQDKRSLATTFDCRQKPLCHTNAACTADPINRNRYTCVCNNGFQGNGSVCQGMRVFFNVTIGGESLRIP